MNNKNTQEYQPVELLIPGESDISDMVSFFVDQIGELKRRGLCTEEEEREYIDWHTSVSLRKKISEQTRFFRIIRDMNGNIIAYFESMKHPNYLDTQVIQWILVDKLHRNTRLSRKLCHEHRTWCRENGYAIIWSYVHKDNKESLLAHDNFRELRTRVGDKVLCVLSLK